ncbi:MAG: HAD family hydrolase [Caulobacteraceae bacterium]|nr:HAD family hydrolase [Caulobacteraceae bacterium]
MTAPAADPGRRIAAVVSDVDGTLVRRDKSLSEATREAVRDLSRAGIGFAVVSSRPPRGMMSIVQDLGVSTLIAGFNGGVIATAALQTLEQHLLSPDVARRAVEGLRARGADVWVFSGLDWLVNDPTASKVAHETHTVGFDPVVVDDFGAAPDAVGKIVGVSENPALLNRCEADLTRELSGAASVSRSQAYYLDITHPLANKGAALRAIARQLNIPLSEVAVIGDGPNDVAMFGQGAFSIAMGNGEPAVRQAADAVTASNEEDGFAEAMHRFVLPEVLAGKASP